MSIVSNLFRNSWSVLWKNPSLWIFGLFLAFLGQGGASEVVLRLMTAAYEAPQEARVRDLIVKKEFWQHGGIVRMVRHYFNPSEPIVLVTMLLTTLVVLVVLIGIVYAMAAVPIATRSFIERKKKISILEAFSSSRSAFFGVATIFLLSSAMFSFLLEIIVFIVRRSDGVGFWQGVGSGALFVVVAVASVVVFFLALYATNVIALRKTSFRSALLEAWRIVARQWMVSIEFGILFALLNVLAALCIAWFMIPFMWPSLLLSSVLAKGGFVVAGRMMLIVGVFIVTLVGAFVQALYATFQTAFWTLLYLALSGRAAPKRRLHMFSSLLLPKADVKEVVL